MDSGVLFGSHEMIEQRVRETAKAAKDMGVRHIMNLGHGIQQARGWAGPWQGGGRGRGTRRLLGGSSASGWAVACGRAAQARAAGQGCHQSPATLPHAGHGLAQTASASRVQARARPLWRPCPRSAARGPSACPFCLPPTRPLQYTPEENAAHFFKVCKELRYADL